MAVLREADRRRRTLAEQLASSSSPSPNLRDLLKLNQDEIHQQLLQRSFSRRASLATFLAGEKREVSAAASSPATVRTLLDVIRDEGDYGGNGGGAVAPPLAPAEPPQQARTSLMALLEEADRQVVPPPPAPEEKEDEGEEEEEGKGTGSRCCVCMVREKGAAFIPCGHTFCRICSRELWISRRNCPLCNALIHEILDIF